MTGRNYSAIGDVYSYLKSDESIGNRRQTYLSMSEEQLKYMFRSENWPKDQYEKEWILQSMENHIAAREGRDPCSVITFDQEYDPDSGILRGEHSGKAIFINVNEDLNQYGIMKTLLHEDEHDVQTEETNKFVNDPETAENSKFSRRELESFATEMQKGSYVNPNEGPEDRYKPVDKFGGKSLDEQINGSETGYYDPYRAMNCELDAESRSMDYMTDENMTEIAADDPAYKNFIVNEAKEYVDRYNWIKNNSDVKRDVQLFQAENSQFLSDEQKQEFENDITNENIEDPSERKYRETTQRLVDVQRQLGEEQQVENGDGIREGSSEDTEPALTGYNENDQTEDEDLEIFDPGIENSETVPQTEDEDLEIFDPDAEYGETNPQNEQDEDIEIFDPDIENRDESTSKEQTEAEELVRGDNDLIKANDAKETESESKSEEEDNADSLVSGSQKDEEANGNEAAELLNTEKSVDESEDNKMDNADNLVDKPDETDKEEANKDNTESQDAENEGEDSAEDLVNDSDKEESNSSGEENASDLVEDSGESESADRGTSETPSESASVSDGGQSSSSGESGSASQESDKSEEVSR